MDHIDEAELLEACKAGDRSAFNIIVRRYQERVYWAVRRLVNEPDDAKDIAQETFIRGWLGISGFRGDSQLFTWLYRIAVNLSLNHLRKEKLRSFLRIDKGHEFISSSPEQFSKELDEDDINLIVDKAMQQLPEKQRITFMMRYYEEMSYEEMAKVLNKSVGGLKANYHHAVKKVQEYVKNAMQ